MFTTKNTYKQLSLDLFDTKMANLQPDIQFITLPSGDSAADGQIMLYPNFFAASTRDKLFDDLLQNLNWRQDKIKMFGKEINLPRLTAWYGDEGKSYEYSGIKMNPDVWTPTLLTIKKQVEAVAKLNFNSVLVNLYRSGKDHVSWHSDDEPELGNNPTIASVSFGATRRFLLKHKSNQDLGKIEVPLTHGSLLIMQGTTQHFWQHQVPKTTKILTARINLTFRVIL